MNQKELQIFSTFIKKHPLSKKEMNSQFLCVFHSFSAALSAKSRNPKPQHPSTEKFTGYKGEKVGLELFRVSKRFRADSIVKEREFVSPFDVAELSPPREDDSTGFGLCKLRVGHDIMIYEGARWGNISIFIPFMPSLFWVTKNPAKGYS